MCRGINCLLMSAVFIKLILYHIERTNRLECLVQTMERHNCARKQMNCNCCNYQTQPACQLIGRQHFPFDAKYTGVSNPLKAGIAFAKAVNLKPNNVLILYFSHAVSLALEETCSVIRWTNLRHFFGIEVRLRKQAALNRVSDFVSLEVSVLVKIAIGVNYP